MPEANSSNRATIMIIDDDEDARETLRYLLEREGYFVLAAENGQKALELLHTQSSPCLILLDLLMPVMDGWAFLSALESDGALSKIPIVVVSGRAEHGVNYDHVMGVIHKPIDTKALLRTVREHCGACGKAGG